MKSYKDIAQLSTTNLRPPSPSITPKYPTYALPSHTSTFTIPPRGSLISTTHDPKQKPPSPPRRPPASIPRPTTPSGTSSGRLASLVNLFGRSSPASQAQPPSSTPIPIPTENTSGSRPPSILSAYAISSSIHTREALRGIWRAHVSFLSAVPSILWTQDAVFPVLRFPLPGAQVKRRRRRRDDDNDSGYRYEIDPYGASSEMGSWKDIEDLAAIWQSFYADLEDEIRGSADKSRKSSEGNDSYHNEKKRISVMGEEALDAEETQDREDACVREVLKRVEKVLFSKNEAFGRLFSQL
ncbi:hypothetical protein Moror_5505 [Moniliophthora roreri MCA 2997]|uniref:Uncharacterized protein n=1 Tax=Moniliophthora roreri (strain MCA 2997) TaxID=1381753 RepID=V2X6Y8_MONRO|nr:hypothetical protein Moror_5505 [Moniliophthora roreri MCA 2997]